MKNTNIENDINSDNLTIESDLRMTDAAPDDSPVWIENEDGSGQWSDGWTGAYEDLPIEFRSMDAFAPGVIDESDIPF